MREWASSASRFFVSSGRLKWASWLRLYDGLLTLSSICVKAPVVVL